ncbi:hypothetical protein PG997_012328 [Apiospora hydei]|uniref:Uncharacterized protein n=1 Tax=Apiospora hydei TaxID=1337664 RepID=A0ABR1V335_9PEZI
MPQDPAAKKSTAESRAEDRDRSTDEFNHICELLGINSVQEREYIRNLVTSDPKLAKLWSQYGLVTYTAPLKALTLDELEFVKKLKKSGELEKLMAVSEMSTSNVTFDQLRDAISDMDQFTDAIEKQLATHQAHIARQIAALRAGGTWIDQRSAMEETKKRALLKEKSRLEEETKEKEEKIKRHADTLANLLRADQESHVCDSSCRHQQYSLPVQLQPYPWTESPTPYDTLLKKLQALGWELDPGSKGNSEIMEAARYYASEEVYVHVRNCRVSLNTAFREAAQTYNSSAPVVHEYNQAVEAEMIAILEEIQSLWEEVVPVAHMAAEKQLLGPILRRFDLNAERRSLQQDVICDYICACLDFMNERLQILARRLGVAVYHHQSLVMTYNYARKFVLKNSVAQRSTEANSSKPLRSDGAESKSSPLEVLTRKLQSLGLPRIPLNNPIKAPAAQVTKLNEFVNQRAAKGDETLLRVHKMYEETVRRTLDDVSLASRMAQDAIVAESLIDWRTRGAALQDAQTEESIAALQKESEEIESLLAKLELPGTGNIAKMLRPALLRALKHLESGDDCRCDIAFSRAFTPCTKCVQSSNAVKLIQQWGELPEFKSL